MHPTAFVRDVWAAILVGNFLLLAVLFLRHRARQFPAFTLYIANSTISSLILYWVLYHAPFSAYRSAYFADGILDEVLQLLVIYEVAVHVFCPTGTWAHDVRKTFVWLVCASTLVGLCLSWVAQPAAPLRIQTFILRTDFFSSVIMSELFVGMVVLSVTAGLPWKTHVARIAQAWGAYSIECLAADIVVNCVGISQNTHIFAALSYVKKLTYVGCQLYWIVMLWREAPAKRELPEDMRNQIYFLQQQVEYDLMKIRVWRRN